MANILGLITVNGKQILEVDADPSAGAGTAADKASLAMYDNGSLGSLYVKTGAADTAWQQVDVPEGRDWELFGNDLTGGSPVTPNEYFGSNNDYDVAYRRNSLELMRLCAGGLLIGLNASLGGRLQVKTGLLGDEIVKQISPNGGVGTAQVITVTRHYKVQTTDGTPTVLASLVVPAASRVQANWMINGNQTGGTAGAAGDGVSYERTFAAKRLAAGSALLQRVQTDFTQEDVPVFDVGFAVNTNNIDLSVTGDTDRTVIWTAYLNLHLTSN